MTRLPPRPRMGSVAAGAVRSCAGFTLLEIVVAVAILSVAMVSVLALHARNVRLTAEAQDLTVAGLLASRVVAFTRAGDLPEYGVTEGRFDTRDDGDLSLEEDYGGELSERFVWKREVTAVGLTPMANLRQVKVSVGIDGGPTLAELNFLVRRKLQ